MCAHTSGYRRGDKKWKDSRRPTTYFTFLLNFMPCNFSQTTAVSAELTPSYLCKSVKRASYTRLKKMNHFVTLVILSLAVSGCYSQTPRLRALQPHQQTGEVGSDFTFTCEGAPSPTIQWIRNDTITLVNDQKHSILMIATNGTARSQLTIMNAQLQDSGEYLCRQGSNEFGVSLTVHRAVDVNITGEPVYVEGGNLQLTCLVDGMTNSSVRWMFDRSGSPETLQGGTDESHVQVLPNNTLIVRQLVPADAGIYICNYTFPEGSKTAKVYVGGAITLKTPKSVKYTEGDRALMECQATVLAQALMPNITWLVEGNSTDDNERITVEKSTIDSATLTVTSKLEITKITREDRKNYTCVATNAAGSESADILLRVRDRLAALWPFIGIVSEVVLLIIIIFVHEKCSKGEDYGEDDEDDEDEKKEKKEKISDGEGDIRMRATKE